MTLPLETRPIPRGRPPRRVMAGEGLVGPVERLILTEKGKTEELIPGRDRFARDHPVVRKNPEFFTPCDREDFETYRRHRQLLVATRNRIEREIAGTTRATTSSPQKRFTLSGPPRGRFRLP